MTLSEIRQTALQRFSSSPQLMGSITAALEEIRSGIELLQQVGMLYELAPSQSGVFLQYPKMVYRNHPTMVGEVDNMVVESSDDEAKAQKEGWRLTPQANPPAAPQAQAPLPPTVTVTVDPTYTLETVMAQATPTAPTVETDTGGNDG